MAELRNCPQCGRVFGYIGRNLCPRCMDKEEEEFKVVRTYIRDNPGANITETAEATGIDEQKILWFLRDGRLISKGLLAAMALSCDRCGQPIKEGRYCQACLTELDRELKGSLHSRPSRQEENTPSPERIRSHDRMHIMNSRKKDN